MAESLVEILGMFMGAGLSLYVMRAAARKYLPEHADLADSLWKIFLAMSAIGVVMSLVVLVAMFVTGSHA